MTTYRPSGAPGKALLGVADSNVRVFKAPNGARALAAALCHCDSETFSRNSEAALLQL
jgi:hypothetical protein